VRPSVPPVAADPQLAEEQEHLDLTYAAYDALLDALSVSRRDRQGDVFTEEVLERMRLERLRAYTSASGPLYFGRIDRPGEGPLYVGRHAVADEGNELLAINWRAPAAEPFYAATTADPRGVSRRRRLDVEDRTVRGFVDEQLQVGEDHLTEAIVEDITRQRVGEMRQIISTITPEQYALITEPPEGALVVQGGPGTGKTAVGLHRAAWLLYADPALAREGVLVVGPNRVFIAYISQVLPSLGEQSVEQRPIDALVSRRPWAEEESAARADLLGSGRLATVLSRLLWDRVGPPGAPVRIEVGRTEVELGPDEVADVIAEARTRLTYEAGRERFRERLADRVATELMERSATARRADPEAVASAVRQTRAYQRVTAKSWPRQTPDALMRSLFANRRRLAALAGDLLAAEEIDLLLASPPPKTGVMTHGEFALLDEARALIDPELRRFGHVVVDEAQNLTPMELRMVVRRARRRSLTVLGDIAQRTAEAHLSTWEAVLGEAGVDSLAVEELLVSYRVPDDFLRIASAFAPGAAVPEGVRRAPWAAVAVRTERPGAVAAELAARMAGDVGSVGVIVPAALREGVAAAFGPGATAAEESLSSGINLLGLEAIKGLEFDAAVVLEPRLILGERPAGGRGGLYTALTRSTRALAVVHDQPLPEELVAAPDLAAVPEAGAAAAWAAGLQPLRSEA
jgi:DNA helicase IV